MNGKQFLETYNADVFRQHIAEISNDEVANFFIEAVKNYDWLHRGARFTFAAAAGFGVSNNAVEQWLKEAPADFKLTD